MRFWRRIFIVLVLSAAIILLIAQVVLSMFLKPVLMREGERIFEVPVSIERAGANLFNGSVWMKGVRVKNPPGFEETYFLEARTISFDLSFLSLLTREFSVSRVSFKEPQFTFEVNKQGRRNEAYFAAQALEQFAHLIRKRPRFIYVATSYLLGKFVVRNGVIQYINQQNDRRNWVLKSVSFSVARALYPPDPEEALPTAIYLNAVIPGVKEGKIVVLGRLSPFTEKKSFDITGSVKNLGFEQMSHFVPDFPLAFADGVFQIKIKAVCHDNQADVHEQVRIEGLKFHAKGFKDKKTPLIFGLPQETVVHFFNDLQPATEPFEFELRVTGDMSDPKFDLVTAFMEKTRQAVHDSVLERVKIIEEKTKVLEGRALSELEKVVG